MHLIKPPLKAENHALQCTTAGPYNAITTKLLAVGSVCGLGPYLVGIHSISLAACYRVAACSSTLHIGLEKVSVAHIAGAHTVLDHLIWVRLGALKNHYVLLR